MITTTNNSTVTSGQYVDALSAHREWATRPADQRYQSLEALHAAACAQTRNGRGVIERAATLKAAGTEDGAVILIGRQAYANLNNWSFGQLATAAKAPASYLRTLPANLAADCLNEGLTRLDAREAHALYLDAPDGETPTVRALTSTIYERIHNHQLTERVLALKAGNQAWQLPMGYKDGKWGAELVPSGAYLSDRDMFVMIIDGNRGIDDPTDTTHGGLFRGIIVKNSEVGAAKLSIDLFLFRRVCGNNIIWGFQHVAGFARRHVGKAIHRAWDVQLRDTARALNADTSHETLMIGRAVRTEIGRSKPEVLQLTEPIVGKALSARAYELAERHEPNPRSVWGFAQGITRASQETTYQDSRFDSDRDLVRSLMNRFVN